MKIKKNITNFDAGVGVLILILWGLAELILLPVRLLGFIFKKLNKAFETWLSS